MFMCKVSWLCMGLRDGREGQRWFRAIKPGSMCLILGTRMVEGENRLPHAQRAAFTESAHTCIVALMTHPSGDKCSLDNYSFIE